MRRFGPTVAVFRSVRFIVAGLALGAGLSAHGRIEVSSEPLEAVPAGANARITARTPAGATVSAARVYFNAAGKTPEYYLEMVRGDAGFFWAMLPVPKPETKQVQYRVVISDGEGKPWVVPQATVPVKGSAKVEPTDAEMRYARNLVIGVTDPSAPLLPEGWECIGVVSSINIRGELKPNEVCRTVVIPPALWVTAGAAAATTGIIIMSDPGEPPPAPPPPVSPATAPAAPAAPPVR